MVVPLPHSHPGWGNNSCYLNALIIQIDIVIHSFKFSIGDGRDWGYKSMLWYGVGVVVLCERFCWGILSILSRIGAFVVGLVDILGDI